MSTMQGQTPVNPPARVNRRVVPPPSPPTTPAKDLASAAVRPGVDPCDVACDAMPGFVVGDLAPPDATWLLSHTGGCAYCHDALHCYERLGTMLDRLNRFVTEDAPPPPFAVWPRCRAGYARIQSPLGPLFVAASDKGVCEIGFGKNQTEAAFQHQLETRGFRPVPDWTAVEGVARQLREYFSGERNRFEVPLDFSGVTPFARSVLAATAEVPFGRLSTYREIAQRVGQPKATRAVGNALGRNPIPVIVPCHRIVRSDSSLGGYTGGLDIKKHLLSLEGALLS